MCRTCSDPTVHAPAARRHASALRTFAVVLLLAACPPMRPAFAQGPIAAPIRVDAGAGTAPVAVAVAELNGDAFPDIVVANNLSSTVSVLLGSAGGYLPKVDYATGNGPSAVAVADLNRDGQPDLIVADGRSNTLSILLGAGGGSFLPRTVVNVGSLPSGLAVGDWNQDGKPDLAVAIGLGSVYLLRGNGLGGFATPQAIGVGGGPQALAAGDLDGDGHTDLVVALGESNTLLVLNGNGLGGFEFWDAIPTPASPQSVALADLDGDGHLDAAVACAGANAVCVLRGDGSGTLPFRTDFAAGNGPSGVAIGDLNGDHHLDLIVTNPVQSRVTELLGDGAGAFTFGLFAPMGNGCRAIATASLNGDSLGDFVTANGGANTVSICVGGGSAVLSLATNPNPVLTGLTVTMTATIVPFLNGTITFLDGSTPIATAPLVNGVATAGYYGFSAGTHTLTASYPGGGGAGATTSLPVQQVVTGPLVTTLSLSVAPSPSIFGAPVLLTATITPATATGVIDFDDGVTYLGSGSIVNGVAQRLVTNFDVGSHTLLAVYPGYDLFLPGRSSAVPHSVTPASTTTAVTSKANPATPGDTLVFTATVAPVAPGAGTPTGLVQFELDGGVVGGPVALSGGHAVSAPIVGIGVGTHLVDARYLGAPGYAASVSPAIGQVIAQAPTTTTLTASANPAIFGQALTFRAVVASNPPYTIVPTGSVQFVIDGVDTGAPVALVAGAATSPSMPALTPGSRQVRARYSGSGACLTSTSGVLNETIQSPFGAIRSIRDVPDDQGRLVRLIVARSPFDAPGAAPVVVRYSVFRRIAEAGLAARESAPDAVQLAGWDQVAGFDAYQDTLYSVLVPTLADSSSSGTHRSAYMVRAATAVTSVYFDSPPDSGYSVDNLPPSSPAPFTATRIAGATHLHWGANGEPDFAVYRIYRGAAPDFVPGPGALIAQQPDTGYVDAGPPGSTYKLSAVDLNGDESPFAVATSGDAIDTPGGALAFALEPVGPNPSPGPGLRVRFTLPVAAPARLELLDVGGRRVAVRDAGAMGAGRHDVDLLDGARAGAGLYFVRLSQGSAVRTVRVALLR